MLEVNPALVIGIGDCAAQILRHAQELIFARCEVENVPDIFQFVSVPAVSVRHDEQLLDSFAMAMSARASAEAERSQRFSVDASAMQVFVIFVLQSEPLDIALEMLGALREQTHAFTAGGVNAIALVPQKLFSLNKEALHRAAQKLDAALQRSNSGSAILPFNRCFFLDEFNESGQMINQEEELIELAARFVSLSLASELTQVLRKNPPPYIGDGAHYQAYASFCCNYIGFDRQALALSLASKLATDISKRLFATSGVTPSRNPLWDRAGYWFEQSVRESSPEPEKEQQKSPQTPPAPEPTEPDYQKINNDFRDFTLELCKACHADLTLLQQLIDRCLDRGMAQLEAYADKIIQTKNEISELLIKIMLNESRPQPESKWVDVKKPRTGLIITLSIIGVLAIGAGFVSGSVYPFIVGVAALLGALVVYLSPEKEQKEIPAPLGPSYEKELKEKKRKYERQKKTLDHHRALYAQLDLAHANLATLRVDSPPPSLKPPESILDLDLLDERVVQSFYTTRYQDKESDITSFISPSQIERFHHHLFSYPEIVLLDVLREYSFGRFNHVAQFSLEDVWQTRASLSVKRDSITLLSPFWHPFHPNKEEKMIVSLLGKNFHQSMSELLRNLFRAGNVQLVDSHKLTEATVIQISYGLRIEDIFILARHA